MRQFSDYAANEMDAVVKEVELSFNAANESNSELESMREKFMKPQEEAKQRILTIAGAVDTALRMYPKENAADLGFEAEMLYRLMNFKPLTAVLGEDDEWIPLTDVDLTQIKDMNFDFDAVESIEVNRRCPSLFRANHDNKYAWDADGRIFTNDDGKSFFRDWRSSMKVTFPYLPNTVPEMVDAHETPEDCAYNAPDNIPEDMKADLEGQLAQEREEA